MTMIVIRMMIITTKMMMITLDDKIVVIVPYLEFVLIEINSFKIDFGYRRAVNVSCGLRVEADIVKGSTKGIIIT